MGPNSKDSSIWGSTLESPCSWELPYFVQKRLAKLACSSLAQDVMQDLLKNLNIANNTGGVLGEINSTTKAGAVKATQRVSKEGIVIKEPPTET